MDSTTLIGFLGAATLLAAFVGDEFKMLRSDSLAYGVLNFVGAMLLVWYALLLASVPFLVVEGVWALVGLRELWKALAGRGK